jgi:hypothetical protein
VNYAGGDVVPNAVLASIGTGGKVCIYNLAATDLVVDVNGYVPAQDVAAPGIDLSPVEWTITAGGGVRTIFMIADASPLTVNAIQDLGGSLIWPETTITLCNDPSNPGIDIRLVGNGYVRIGDGFQSNYQTSGCAINTAMAQAFADFGNPSKACLYVTTGDRTYQYCAPLKTT